MTAKAWLMRGWRLNEDIDRLMAVHDAVKAKALSVTASLTGDVVQSTKDPHKFDRLAECMDELNASIDRYVDTMREIERVIQQIPDGRYRTLLRDRYLLFKPWERIAVDEGYNIRHVWRLHGEALKAAEAVIEEVIPMKK